MGGEQESSRQEQQQKIRQTGGYDDDADLLSVMKNEGVILELSGLVRTTSGHLVNVKTIKSVRSCLSFGLCHNESLGRHTVNASHECRLNILLARHQSLRGNKFRVKYSEAEHVVKALRKEGVTTVSVKGLATNSYEIAKATRERPSDEFIVEAINDAVICELVSSGRLSNEDERSTHSEVARE